MIQTNEDLREKWKAAVRWLGDELERGRVQIAVEQLCQNVVDYLKFENVGNLSENRDSFNGQVVRRVRDINVVKSNFPLGFMYHVDIASLQEIR